jgi:hypothetical protein
VRWAPHLQQHRVEGRCVRVGGEGRNGGLRGWVGRGCEPLRHRKAHAPHRLSRVCTRRPGTRAGWSRQPEAEGAGGQWRRGGEDTGARGLGSAAGKETKRERDLEPTQATSGAPTHKTKALVCAPFRTQRAVFPPLAARAAACLCSIELSVLVGVEQVEELLQILHPARITRGHVDERRRDPA